MAFDSPCKYLIEVFHSPACTLKVTQQSLYDTEQDGMKIASHSNLPYFLHPKGLKNSSCKLPDVPN